jgi:hypothetical protein
MELAEAKTVIQGWESKLRRILQNVNKRRYLGTNFLFVFA